MSQNAIPYEHYDSDEEPIECEVNSAPELIDYGVQNNSDSDSDTDQELIDDDNIYDEENFFNDDQLVQPIGEQEDDEMEGMGADPLPRWELLEQRNDSRSRFKLFKTMAKFKVHHNLYEPSDILRYNNEIAKSFYEAIHKLLIGYTTDHKITVTFETEEMDNPFSIPPVWIDEFNPKLLVYKLEGVTQSKKEILLNGPINVTIHIFEAEKGRGGGRSKREAKSYDEIKKQKKGIITIRDDTHMCGYIAIALGKFMIDNNIVKCRDNEEEDANSLHSRNPQWKSLIRYKRPQRELAERFCEELDIEYENPLRIDKLAQIQRKLIPNYCHQ
jgi:hypothetical protein